MASAVGFSTEQYAFINETIGNATSGPYADVGVGFVLQSAYMVFFMHCGFAMVRHTTSHMALDKICYRPFMAVENGSGASAPSLHYSSSMIACHECGLASQSFLEFQ